MRYFAYVILFAMLSFLPFEVHAQTRPGEAACRAKLNGSNGCYSMRSGSCQIGFSFCTAQNCGNNGGIINGGSCVSKNSAQPTPTPEVASQAPDCNGSDRKLTRYNDGTANCLCNSNGSVAVPGQACETAANSQASTSEQICKSKGGVLAVNPETGSEICECQGKYEILLADQKTCSDLGKSSTAASTDDFECLSYIQKQVDECKDQGSTAKTQCDAVSKENSSYSQVGQLLTGGAQIFSQMKTGTGEQPNCAKAGLMAAGLHSGLNTLKEDCSDKTTTCRATCDGVGPLLTSKDTIEKCKIRYINKYSLNTAVDNAKINAYVNDLKEKIIELKDKHTEGVNTCKVDARSNAENLAQLMNDASNATQSAAICQCADSATGTNCTNMPTLAECAANPLLAGCAAIAGLTCAPNSLQYSSNVCVCYREPGNAVCITTSGGANNVASVGGAAAGAGPAAAIGSPTYSGANGGGNDNLDLSGLNPDQKIEQAAGTASSPFGGAPNGGGAGGGGGGMGGAPSGDGEPHAEAPGSGIGGMFNQLKNFADRTFGGSGKLGSSNGTAKNGDGKSVVIDPNKWKLGVGNKLRGLAGSSGIGGKNGDIWKTMNGQYSMGQDGTFLTPDGRPQK